MANQSNSKVIINADIEEYVTKNQLKEAKRTKLELQSRLAEIDNAMSYMQTDATNSSTRVNLLESTTRRHFQEEESRKRAEAAQFARKVALERKQLKQRQKEQLTKKIAKDKLKQQRREAREKLEFEKKEEDKKLRIQQLQKSKSQRQQELEITRKSLQNPEKNFYGSQKAYKKIERSYMTKVVLPQIQERKFAISQRRDLFKPIDSGELAEHADLHAKMAASADYQRKIKQKQRELEIAKNAHNHRVNCETETLSKLKKAWKTERKERERAETELRFRKQRSSEYSTFVRELYSPSVDVSKRLEIQTRKNEQFQPKKLKSSQTVENLPTQRDYGFQSERNSQMSIKMKKKGFAPNSLAPKPKEPRLNKAKDYLAERRDIRYNFESSGLLSSLKRIMEDDIDSQLQSIDNEKANLLKRKVIRIEKKAKRKELMLEKANLNNPDTLDAQEDVSDALISSVRAKLQLLIN